MSDPVGLGAALADWVVALEPSDVDVQLAHRSLVDTMACGLAVPADGAVVALARQLSLGGAAAVVMHHLDFDDLHMESTTHISTVCVPATIAMGGQARDYLAGAGVMARLGAVLGWQHYESGWHATTTTGALAAAAVGASALGLDAERTRAALALAVPASGGVQRAFGTDAKALQVGFAVEAGLRAARLAQAGAGADPAAIDQWARLLSPQAQVGDRFDVEEPAVPGGLAIKLSPCCYALQRPIAAVKQLRDEIDLGSVTRITVSTLEGCVHPLIHHDPHTGLEGKFSLEYGVAAALLDEHVGFDSFTDAAVRRPEAQALSRTIQVETRPGGGDLLDGQTEVRVEGATGVLARSALHLPPGAPARPPTPEELAAKVGDCLRHGGVSGAGFDPAALTWSDAGRLLADHLNHTPMTSTSAGPRGDTP